MIIKGMEMPQHAAVNGEKDTAYKCIILSHPDSSVELVIDSKFASPYDNGHNIQRYPLTEIPTPHGRLIDADDLYNKFKSEYCNINCGSSVQGKKCDHCGVPRALNVILNAPTIIEAEVSE